MSERRWKMVQVVERFKDEKHIPRERLSCGHIRIDPVFHYGNERGWAVGRIGQIISGQLPKARCYKCGRGEVAE